MNAATKRQRIRDALVASGGLDRQPAESLEDLRARVDAARVNGSLKAILLPARRVAACSPRRGSRAVKAPALSCPVTSAAPAPTVASGADGPIPGAEAPPAPGDAPRSRTEGLSSLAAEAALLVLAALRPRERAALPRRVVCTESLLKLWRYLYRAPVVRPADVLAEDLHLAKRTVLRDLEVLEKYGVIQRGDARELLVIPPPGEPVCGNRKGTAGELTYAPAGARIPT